MSRVGREHGKFIMYFNDKLSIKKYLGVCFLISAGLSVCKALQYEINIDSFDLPFPNLFSQNSFKKTWFYIPKYVAITIINGVFDFLNYFLFVMVHLIVDLVLLKKLRRAISEKKQKMIEIKSASELEKALKDAKESEKRALNMVILNSVFNLVSKVPSMITPLNDLKFLTFKKPDQNDTSGWSFYYAPLNIQFTLRVYCALERGCMLFRSFGNFLFLLSSSLVLFFLKSFDMNFKAAFRSTVSQK